MNNQSTNSHEKSENATLDAGQVYGYSQKKIRTEMRNNHAKDMYSEYR